LERFREPPVTPIKKPLVTQHEETGVGIKKAVRPVKGKRGLSVAFEKPQNRIEEHRREIFKLTEGNNEIKLPPFPFIFTRTKL
jgi:hypothetical protein